MQDNTHTFECHCCEQEYRWDEQVTMSPSDMVDGLGWCDTCNTDNCSPSGEFCALNPTQVAEWEAEMEAEWMANCHVCGDPGRRDFTFPDGDLASICVRCEARAASLEDLSDARYAFATLCFCGHAEHAGGERQFAGESICKDCDQAMTDFYMEEVENERNDF